jgi:hypothetical protein
MHNAQCKEERTAVAMAYVVNNKEGEAFPGPNADLERAGKKLEPQVEGSYKRNKPHVDINSYKSNDIEEKEVKHKAPDETIMPTKEEMFEPDALTLEG